MLAAAHATDQPGRSRPADREASRPHPVVRAQQVVGALVLAPEGVFDGAVLRAVDRAVATWRATVVLDLSSCALTHTGVLEQLDPGRWSPPLADVRVVCPRRSARRLLARAGLATRLALFSSVDEAVPASEGAVGNSPGVGGVASGEPRS
jgi:hypothetical protein